MTAAYESPIQRALRAVLAERPDYISRNPKPHVFASEARACSRRIGLRMLRPKVASGGHEPDDSLHFRLAGEIGTVVHKTIQRAIKRAFPDSEPERYYSFGTTTGKVDSVYTAHDSVRTVLEIKTMGVWAYSRSLTRGPSDDHIMQASIGAVALKAPRAHIFYVNRGLDAKTPPITEWEVPVDHGSVEDELLRHKAIVEQVEAGTVPARWYEGELIDNPEKMRWPCGYCPFLVQCVANGPHEYAVSESLPVQLELVRG